MADRSSATGGFTDQRHQMIWVVVDYEGRILPGVWSTEDEAVEQGLCGRYLFTGDDVIELRPSRD